MGWHLENLGRLLYERARWALKGRVIVNDIWQRVDQRSPSLVITNNVGEVIGILETYLIQGTAHVHVFVRVCERMSVSDM